jgi:AcrR family transcriptional regulator
VPGRRLQGTLGPRAARRVPTTKKPKPQKKSEATREKILASALGLFRRRGFEKTTMRDVAAAAGVALGAAYYYFPSKEALVLAYYHDTQAEHSRRARAAMETETSLRARLGAVMHTKLDVLAKDKKLLGAIFRSVADPDDPLSLFGATSRDVRDESLALFEEALQGAPETLAASALAPDAPRIAARALWGLHMGLILYFLHDTSPGQTKTRALADGALDLAAQLVAVAPLLGGLTDPLAHLLREADLL